MQTLKIMKGNQERIAALIFLPDSFDYLLITCHGFREEKKTAIVSVLLPGRLMSWEWGCWPSILPDQGE